MNFFIVKFFLAFGSVKGLSYNKGFINILLIFRTTAIEIMIKKL